MSLDQDSQNNEKNINSDAPRDTFLSEKDNASSEAQPSSHLHESLHQDHHLSPERKHFVVLLATTIVVSLLATLAFNAFLASGSSSSGLSSWWKNFQQSFHTASSTSAIQENNSQYISHFSEEQAVMNVIQKTEPSVVSIIISKDVPVLEQCYKQETSPFGNDPFFQQFFQGSQIQVPSLCQNGVKKQDVGGGSGFIISSDGLILTNKHVVVDTTADYTVLMNDGKKYPATVLLRDPLQDIALIKINKTGLTPLSLGDSDKIIAGQTVVAIGNALGEFHNTASSGIISGLGRTITASGDQGFSETIDQVIQTDAAINPGNSGGPLLNLDGDVIGINTAVAQGAQNIGFALPINRAKKDIKDFEATGKVVYPYLGVYYTPIDAQVAQDNNLPVQEGAWVHSDSSSNQPAIIKGSPADIAGLKAGDIITAVDGVQIDETHSLSDLIQGRSVGDMLTLTVLRDGKTLSIKVTLAERKQS